MDRINGLVTLAAKMKQPPMTFPFDELRNSYFYSSTVDAVESEDLFVSHKDGSANHNISSGSVHLIWSLIVWYMDKNRPLPSGTAFDPYRQKDYERRKAAGFPKPLYPSDIETPEATPEQQKERRRIGGW